MRKASWLSFLKVTFPDGSLHQIYVAFCGVKGDWPWQRDCFALYNDQAFELLWNMQPKLNFLGGLCVILHSEHAWHT